MTKRRKKRRTFEIARAWAWECDDPYTPDGSKTFLCDWAEPTAESLQAHPNYKPFRSARPVAVYIIRRKDFDARRPS